MERVQLEVTAEDMAKTTLFRSVDVTLILGNLRACETRQLKAGETLITQGSNNQSVFIVLRGHLFVKLSSADQFGVSVAVVGDCVGEMSVIDGRPATATVIAEVDSTLLVLPRELIWTLIDHTTLLSRNLLYILAGRLRLGDHIITANQEEQARSRLYATQDLLTTLRNRRWFDESMPRLVEEATRASRPLALVMCEISNLDRLNEQVGRPAADSVIERVALAIGQAVPDPTHAARYTGSQFAVLLPGCAYPVAEKVCEAIRSALKALPPLAHHQVPPVVPRLAMGMASLERGMTPEALEQEAMASLTAARALPH